MQTTTEKEMLAGAPIGGTRAPRHRRASWITTAAVGLAAALAAAIGLAAHAGDSDEGPVTSEKPLIPFVVDGVPDVPGPGVDG